MSDQLLVTAVIVAVLVGSFLGSYVAIQVFLSAAPVECDHDDQESREVTVDFTADTRSLEEKLESARQHQAQLDHTTGRRR